MVYRDGDNIIVLELLAKETDCLKAGKPVVHEEGNLLIIVLPKESETKSSKE